MLKYSFFLIAVLWSSLSCNAGDWPQWRGPNRTDTSDETELLKEWPAEGPELAWVFKDCGIGYSGLAIVGDRLFTMGARDNVTQVICLNVFDGKEVWATKVGDVLENGWGDGPRSTPTVDGDHVYALGGKGDLVCLSAADGKEVWRQNLTKFGGAIPNWGYTESVLVDGNQVVCTPGGEQGAMLALNKMTGEKIWQSEDFKDEAQYASIIAAEHNGHRFYIQITQKSIVGIDAETGKTLWRSDFQGRVAVIPTPIFHEGTVYVTAGYGVGSDLLKIGADNQVKSLYDSKGKKAMKNHHGGVILYDGHVYGYSDGLGWVCQDFETGEVVWNEKNAFGKGAIGYADGMFYLVSENDGEVVLINATPEGWQEKGRFILSPQTKLRKPKGKIWTHPVVANGRLYLRDQDIVYCCKVK